MSDTTETTETGSSAADVSTTTDTARTTEADTAPAKDWQAEAEKWKAFARKHEDAAKANADKAKRFDEFEESQKSELEKATSKATAEAERASKAEAEMARLQAAIDHGLSKEDLDLLGTHGTPEEIGDRAKRLAERLKEAGANKPKPDFGGGDRGTDVTAKASQLTESDMKRMSPEEIVKAHDEGRFSDLLTKSKP